MNTIKYSPQSGPRYATGVLDANGISIASVVFAVTERQNTLVINRRSAQWRSQILLLFARRRILKYYTGQKNDVDAFGYNSAESKPIWVKSGTV